MGVTATVLCVCHCDGQVGVTPTVTVGVLCNFQVEAAHAAMGAQHPLSRRLLGGCDGDPQQLFAFSRRLDHLMPFDAKHAAQHASIVGELLHQWWWLRPAVRQADPEPLQQKQVQNGWPLRVEQMSAS